MVMDIAINEHDVGKIKAGSFLYIKDYTEDNCYVVGGYPEDIKIPLASNMDFVIMCGTTLDVAYEMSKIIKAGGTAKL